MRSAGVGPIAIRRLSDFTLTAPEAVPMAEFYTKRPGFEREAGWGRRASIA